MFEKTRTFLAEVTAEMKKVSWPIKKGKNLKPAERYRELRDSTVTVIVSSLLLAIFIGLVDLALSSLMSVVIG